MKLLKAFLYPLVCLFMIIFCNDHIQKLPFDDKMDVLYSATMTIVIVGIISILVLLLIHFH